MAQDAEDMVELDVELLEQLEKEAASRYTEEDTSFMEVSVYFHSCSIQGPSYTCGPDFASTFVQFFL